MVRAAQFLVCPCDFFVKMMDSAAKFELFIYYTDAICAHIAEVQKVHEKVFSPLQIRYMSLTFLKAIQTNLC